MCTSKIQNTRSRVLPSQPQKIKIEKKKTLHLTKNGPPYCGSGNTPTDMVYLLDSSLQTKDFTRQLHFIADVTSMLTIGPDDTQVALVTFNGDVHLVFDLNDYHNKDDLIAAMLNVAKEEELKVKGRRVTSDIDRALRYTRRTVLSQRRGGRGADVARVVVVITDERRSENTFWARIEAGRVKQEGIYIFTIGVGPKVKGNNLRRLASKPSGEYAYLEADRGDFVDKIKDQLSVLVCTTATSSTTPSTSTTTTTTTTPDIATPTNAKTPANDKPCGASVIDYVIGRMAESSMAEEIKTTVFDILEENEARVCQAIANANSEKETTTTTAVPTPVVDPSSAPAPSQKYIVDCVGAHVGDYSLRSADPTCKTFLQCVTGPATVNTCGGGTLFDVTINVCNWEADVVCPLS